MTATAWVELYTATSDDRDAMLADLRGALRTVPPAIWRDLARRRPRSQDEDGY